MPTSRIMLASTVLLAALACGGDDGSPTTQQTTSSPTPSAMSKAEWVTAVNAICKRVSDEGDAAGEPTEAKDYPAYMEKYIASLERGIADVRKLTPPPEDAAAIETNFNALNDKQVQIVKGLMPELQAAAAKNDTETADAALEKGFGEYQKAYDAAEPWMTQYGLTDCLE